MPPAFEFNLLTLCFRYICKIKTTRNLNIIRLKLEEYEQNLFVLL